MTNLLDSAPRILVVIDRYSSLGGAEGSTHLMMKSLVHRGFQFTVCVLESPEEALDQDLASFGSELIYVGDGGSKTVSKLIKIARKKSPDLLYSVLFRSEVVARLAGLVTRIPVVSSIVSTPQRAEEISGSLRRLKFRLLRWPLRVLSRHWTLRFHSVSSAAASVAISEFKIPSTSVDVVWRGRDPQFLGICSDSRRNRMRNELCLANDEKIIIAIGREDAIKGHSQLIETLGQIDGQLWSLLIVGRPGNASTELTEKIHLLGLEHQIIRLGMRDDVPDLLCASDVFVITSIREGLPGAVLEAMALSIPIVGWDIPSIREATAGCALLVTPGDGQSLKRQIVKSFENSEDIKEMVTRAKKRFDEHFTIATYADGMETFFRKCLVESERRKTYRG